MKNYFYIATVIFGLLSLSAANAAPNTLILAKNNFEENCTRGLPEAVLNPLKVKNHH